MIHISKSLSDTQTLAKALFDHVSKTPFDTNIICLSGDLGSGKTTFTQMLGEILGVKETMTSPTFVIQKKYPISHPHFKYLIHIDAYRLNSEQELLTLGFKEEMENPNNLILIEWPERVQDILPMGMFAIRFAFVDPTTRSIEFPDTISA